MCTPTNLVSLYINTTGVLQTPDDFDDSGDVYDAVGGVLCDSLQSTNEDAVQLLCSRLYSILIGQSEPSVKVTVDEGKKLLEAPVQLATKLKGQGIV